MEFDVFICHASEDKESFVQPLVLELECNDIKVWYDEFSLNLGDSLSEKIDYGLANSRKAVVVLSPFFFQKNWTKRELRGLVARETEGESVIIPIWHNITKREILKFSPPLADLVGADSSEGVEAVAKRIIYSVKSTFDYPTHSTGFLADFEKKPSKQRRFQWGYKYLISVSDVMGKGRNYNLLNKKEGRQFLEIGLVELIEKYKGKKVSIILADIDELTQINKNYSLEVGNEVLLTLFNTMRSHTKEVTDYTGRCGDDTFFSILIGIGIGKSKKIAAEIRTDFENFDWSRIAPNLRVSCSFGISRLGVFEDIRDSVIRASIGMAKAKNSGRNLILEGPKHIPKALTYENVGRYSWS